jgi:uncharacterized membrane protein
MDSHTNDTLLGVLAYLGPLVIVSFLAAKDSHFVKFHVRQGVVLFAAEVAMWMLGIMMWQLWLILNLVNLAVLVLAIIGITNVISHKETKLPIVGDFADRLSI